MKVYFLNYIISFLLVVAVITGMIPDTVSADENPEEYYDSYEDSLPHHQGLNSYDKDLDSDYKEHDYRDSEKTDSDNIEDYSNSNQDPDHNPEQSPTDHEEKMRSNPNSEPTYDIEENPDSSNTKSSNNRNDPGTGENKNSRTKGRLNPVSDETDKEKEYESPTEKPTPTETEQPTDTETEQPTPTELETEEPTPTETEQPTITETEKPQQTPVQTPTQTPQETPTQEQKITPTPQPTDSGSNSKFDSNSNSGDQNEVNENSNSKNKNKSTLNSHQNIEDKNNENSENKNKNPGEEDISNAENKNILKSNNKNTSKPNLNLKENKAEEKNSINEETESPNHTLTPKNSDSSTEDKDEIESKPDPIKEDKTGEDQESGNNPEEVSSPTDIHTKNKDLDLNSEKKDIPTPNLNEIDSRTHVESSNFKDQETGNPNTENAFNENLNNIIQHAENTDNSNSWDWSKEAGNSYPGTATNNAPVPPAQEYFFKPETIQANQNVPPIDKGNRINVEIENSSPYQNSDSKSELNSKSNMGSGVSQEPASNIAVKELSTRPVISGYHIKYDFPEGVTCITFIEYDAKRTFKKTTTSVEVLKNKSTLVKTLPSGRVYKHVNIWVGEGGAGKSEALENGVVGFKVEKAWIKNNRGNEENITLQWYDKEWKVLETQKTGEDKNYLYFKAKTPAYSSFAITEYVNDKNKALNEPQIRSGVGQTLKGLENNTSMMFMKKDLERQNFEEKNKSEKHTGIGKILIGLSLPLFMIIAVFLVFKKRL